MTTPLSGKPKDSWEKAKDPSKVKHYNDVYAVGTSGGFGAEWQSEGQVKDFLFGKEMGAFAKILVGAVSFVADIIVGIVGGLIAVGEWLFAKLFGGPPPPPPPLFDDLGVEFFKILLPLKTNADVALQEAQKALSEAKKLQEDLDKILEDNAKIISDLKGLTDKLAEQGKEYSGKLDKLANASKTQASTVAQLEAKLSGGDQGTLNYLFAMAHKAQREVNDANQIAWVTQGKINEQQWAINAAQGRANDALRHADQVGAELDKAQNKVLAAHQDALLAHENALKWARWRQPEVFYYGVDPETYEHTGDASRSYRKKLYSTDGVGDVVKRGRDGTEWVHIRYHEASGGEYDFGSGISG